MGLKPEVTMSRTKIYQMILKKGQKFSKLIFRDSYLITSVPLSALKATFDLKCSEKLYFPHMFNRASNYSVHLDHLPPIEAYMPQTKKPKDLKNFIKWYDENKHTPFYLPEKLIKYGSSDTEILMETLIKMRKIMNDFANGLDVFYKSCTQASFCMNIYRHRFLKKNHISICPEKGMRDAIIKVL